MPRSPMHSSPTQHSAGFDPAVGFPLRGQFVLFSINAITVGALGTSNVTIDFDGAVYTLTGLSGRAVPLEEFKPHTEYFALGRGTGDLILIGPNDLLEDDVIDVTNTGLPALNIDNYQKFFVDHDTPQVWVGHRTPIAGTLGSGTSALLTDPPDYLGDFPSRPTQRPATVAEYYYDTTLEYFEGGATYLGNLIWTHRDIVYLQGANARWLGQQVNANAVCKPDPEFRQQPALFIFQHHR